MITAGIIAYNEETLLPGCLESLKAKVDRILVVDGRIAGFPGMGGASTDRTVEIARAFGAIVVAAREPCWPSEAAKRNAYLRKSGHGYLLRIDADEELCGDLPGKNGAPDVDGSAYALMLYREEEKDGYGIAAYFARPALLHYEGAHFLLFDGERLISKMPLPVITTAHLVHRQARRPVERVAQKSAFHLAQNEQEKAARQRWGV